MAWRRNRHERLHPGLLRRPGQGGRPIATIIILVLLSEIALITPPIGMSVFLIAGVAKVQPGLVFRGVLPFFATSVVLLWLLVLFPAISTWLPNLFYGPEPGRGERQTTPQQKPFLRKDTKKERMVETRNATGVTA